VEETKIKERWRSYFFRPFNGERSEFFICLEKGVQEGLWDEGVCSRSSKEMGKDALGKMKLGKAIGPDLIPVEIWKCLGEEGVEWLMELFNVICRTVKMHSEWRTRTVTPLYKNKGVFRIVIITEALSCLAIR